MLEYPQNFVASNRTAGMGWELLISDKYVFGGTTFGQQVLFGVPINFIAGDDGNYFNVAPSVGVNTSYSAYNPNRILYDTSNRRFVMIANSMKNCTLMTAKESEFSWVTGKDFVYMANSRYDGGSVYAILQDVEAPNSRYLYVMKVSAYGGVTQTKFMKWIIRGLKKQLVLQYILVYLGFYAVGNTVYHFDMEGHRQNQFIWMEKRSRC
ncbi:MAG: hypothetical protein ACLU4N_12645 [Butyricimonas faecihominis]